MGDDVGTDAEVRAEKHGKETGIILATLENLGENMKTGFDRGEKRFDKIEKNIDNLNNLKCIPNTEKITEFHKWYIDHKEMKKYIVKTVIKIVLPLFVGASSVFAYFKG